LAWEGDVEAQAVAAEVLPTFANMQPMKIGIEACAGSHYWARELIKLGHDAKLIAAQHTRAYVTGAGACYR
jgi:transposase